MIVFSNKNSSRKSFPSVEKKLFLAFVYKNIAQFVVGHYLLW